MLNEMLRQEIKRSQNIIGSIASKISIFESAADHFIESVKGSWEFMVEQDEEFHETPTMSAEPGGLALSIDELTNPHSPLVIIKEIPPFLVTRGR
jgi:hypothetical protein